MEDFDSSTLGIIGTIIAVLAIGGIGVGVATNPRGDTQEKTQSIKLNILPSQKFTTADGTEYRVGDEIKLSLGEKLVGSYSSKNCESVTKTIDEEVDSIFTGKPLCEADCNDDNSDNLEIIADGDEAKTCDAYFERQRAGTNIDEPSDEPSDEAEELEDFPENYVFGEEV